MSYNALICYIALKLCVGPPEEIHLIHCPAAAKCLYTHPRINICGRLRAMREFPQATLNAEITLVS